MSSSSVCTPAERVTPCIHTHTTYAVTHAAAVYTYVVMIDVESTLPRQYAQAPSTDKTCSTFLVPASASVITSYLRQCNAALTRALCTRPTICKPTKGKPAELLAHPHEPITASPRIRASEREIDGEEGSEQEE